ncbi:hypothetical protein LG200_04005 [Methylobacillus caricis]|uniref:hypothetical protein n=1 Tax=Methylobacillus caricis TaxID=1971611 RepID=UPI001CFFFF1E|nr:hypothetical protein [Methylobacillus caricis]MCB5187167.1 hypothetical protein [Methylobacillus caricis]
MISPISAIEANASAINSPLNTRPANISNGSPANLQSVLNNLQSANVPAQEQATLTTQANAVSTLTVNTNNLVSQLNSQLDTLRVESGLSSLEFEEADINLDGRVSLGEQLAFQQNQQTAALIDAANRDRAALQVNFAENPALQQSLLDAVYTSTTVTRSTAALSTSA